MPIPGTRRIPYLEENIAAVDLTLSAQEIDRLEDIFYPGAVTLDRYTAEGMEGVNV